MLSLLPPAIQQEAAALQQRFAGRLGSGGGPGRPRHLLHAALHHPLHPNLAHGHPSMAPPADQLHFLYAHRRQPRASSRRAAAAADTYNAAVEPPAVLDQEALLTLVRLVQLQQPALRPLIARVFSNACANGGSREGLLQLLLAVLRAPLSAAEGASCAGGGSGVRGDNSRIDGGGISGGFTAVGAAFPARSAAATATGVLDCDGMEAAAALGLSRGGTKMGGGGEGWVAAHTSRRVLELLQSLCK